jgi:hypothetical protein
VERQDLVQFAQPVIDATLEQGGRIASLAAAVTDQSAAEVVRHGVAGKLKYRQPRLLHRQPMQIESGVDGVVALAQALEYAVLHSVAFPCQHVPGLDGHNLLRPRQMVAVAHPLLLGGLATDVEPRRARAAFRADDARGLTQRLNVADQFVESRLRVVGHGRQHRRVVRGRATRRGCLSGQIFRRMKRRSNLAAGSGRE